MRRGDALSRVSASIIIVVIVAISSIGGVYFFLSGANSITETNTQTQNSTSSIPTSFAISTIVSQSITLSTSTSASSTTTSILQTTSSLTTSLQSSTSSTSTSCANVAQYNMTVPSSYSNMYGTLNQILENFDQNLDSTQPVNSNQQVIYATELLPADSNLVTGLLAPGQLQGVENNLNAMEKVGVQGVTIDVSYPILSPTFANYSQYLSFYESVVQQVRERGMKIDIESQTPLLVGYPGVNTGNLSYSNLSYNTYVTQLRQMIQIVIDNLHPDYYNIGSEVDTLYNLLPYPQLSNPKGWGNYISSLVTGLNESTTKIAVGIGSWDSVAYLNATVANPAIQAIDVHVYPMYGNITAVLMQIGRIAAEYNKPIDIDEMGLHKSIMNEGQGQPGGFFTADAIIRSRNIYSFWIPEDEQFLSTMSEYAKVFNGAFISYFDEANLFGYANYTATLGSTNYLQLIQLGNQLASANMRQGIVSPTGCYFDSLAHG
jgi:hypothetical protein